MDTLKRLGDALYGDRNPAILMFKGTTHQIASG